jgi:hypothetical protein
MKGETVAREEGGGAAAVEIEAGAPAAEEAEAERGSIASDTMLNIGFGEQCSMPST